MSSPEQHEIASAAAPRSSEINSFSDFSIGSLLLRMGKITNQDAEKIMQLHKNQGLRFGEAAQQLGLVTEADIQQVLARQFDYPYLQQGQGSYSNELITAYQPFSARADVFRDIRSQLMLHWFSAGKKALAISSVNSGEGVTYLSANLAIVFSQLGQRTLLIDANLRQSRQHEVFKLSQKLGLSDILAGRAESDAVSNLESFENLSVLSAGTQPPNPQELVSRPAFGQLIDKYVAEYDVILVDSPAFSVGADAYSISASLRGVVLATRQNITKISELQIISEQLKNNGTQVVGSVLLDF